MIAHRLARAGVAAAIALLLGLAALSAARAASIEYLAVAAVTVYPGDIITEDMLTDGRFPPGTAAGYPVIGSRSELVGKVARRTLLPGRLIARNAIGDPELVQKGKIISAVYEQGALLITASVLALQSGSLGHTIEVRNIDSGKVIAGTVRADGSVGIDAK
jgi:flagella basal body P-ring formation protein FlgA